MDTVGIFAFLAAVVEAVCRAIYAKFKVDDASLQKLWGFLPLVLGIGAAEAMRFNVLTALASNMTKLQAEVGIVLTGLIIGSGSGVVHDIIKLIENMKDVQKAKASNGGK